MHRHATIVALAASGLFASAAPTARAETITVCASGCDHTSINAAIDASKEGDVIQLGRHLRGRSPLHRLRNDV